MATKTVSDKRARLSQSPMDLERARSLLAEIVDVASRTDRMCFHTFGEFAISEGEHLDAEYVGLVLDQLRDTIKRMGWMADLSNSLLSGGEVFSIGDAEAWLLSPAYNSLRIEEVPLG